MIRLIYNLLFPIALLLMLPGYLLRMVRRGNYRHKFGQRFGIYSTEVREKLATGVDNQIWVHAVSVGEVRIAQKLLAEMKSRDPALRAVLSTTTSTAFAMASQDCPDWLEIIYNPVDFILSIRSALRAIRPRMLILVEAEVWPNLVSAAKHQGIPSALVNARLSPRSQNRFRRFKWLTGPVFRKLDLICVQEHEHLAIWQTLGMPAERLRHTGSIKFDNPSATSEPTPPPTDLVALLAAAGAKPGAPVLLGGSTHNGEETLLAGMFLSLRQKYPDLFLVLAPRHFERTPDILPELEPLGLKVALRTTLTPDSQVGADCLLLNTTGELGRWYSLATMVFIGKSITARGGQNPVEPVTAGKPVLFGPHMENFAEIVTKLLHHGAAVQVQTPAQLEAEIDSLLADPARRDAMQAGAHAALAEHHGATARTADALDDIEVKS